MMGLATPPVARDVWARRLRRARQLDERYPFASELLRLYEALLPTQERAFLEALDAQLDPTAVAPYVAAGVWPDVVQTTAMAGPPALVAAVSERLGEGDAIGAVARWLQGEPQPPVERYLARAATSPVLEALGPLAGAACSAGASAVLCPLCDGLPQVSYLSDAGEALVSGPRMLACCRCGASWIHQRMTCAACGEQSTSKLPIFADAERLPHLRADACETCRRYLITVDLRKDPEAVPAVDELVALPLDLYVQERGFAKIVPNLMAIG